MADWVWIQAGSYYAVRWREWLAARRAPCLSEWAETRDERDSRRDCASVAYHLPSKMPPATSDDEARDAVYDHIRFRLKARTAACGTPCFTGPSGPKEYTGLEVAMVY